MTASSKISICIPSYNRKKLSECLSSLIPLVRNMEIPVYVQDNYEGPPFDCSIFSYPHLHYEQNLSNIGADLNMFRCLRKAQTSHALWLGDDDHITEAFLQYIYICKMICPICSF